MCHSAVIQGPLIDGILKIFLQRPLRALEDFTKISTRSSHNDLLLLLLLSLLGGGAGGGGGGSCLVGGRGRGLRLPTLAS